MSQKTFALDRDANFHNLQEALSRFRVWAPEWAHTQRRGLARRLEPLIKQIEFCGWRDGCTARIEVLCARTGMSERTLRRTIVDAEQLGLLEVVRGAERDDRTGGYGANRYRIDWERIERLAVAKCPVGHDGRALYKEEDQSKNNTSSTSADVVLKSGKAWPEKITKAELADPKQVDRLYRIAVRVFEVPDTDRDRRGFHAAARQASSAKVSVPGALFTTLVRERAWNHWPGTPKAITEQSDAEAAKLIKLVDRGPPKPRVADLEERPKSRDEQMRALMERYGIDTGPLPTTRLQAVGVG